MMSEKDNDVLRKISREDGVLESQVDSNFTFLISPSITIGVDIRLLAHAFKNIVFRKIKTIRFESPITGFVFFPTIVDPEIISGAPQNTVKYKRKEKCYFVGLVIPFIAWSRASLSERVDLLTNNLIDSLNAVPGRHLFDSEKQEIIKVVKDVRDYLLSGEAQSTENEK